MRQLQDSEKPKQISELIEKVARDFQCQSLLQLAAQKGKEKHFRNLLDFDENTVDCLSPDGSRVTLLMLAARVNEVDVVQFLVERGTSVNLEDNRGYTPLHQAVIDAKIPNMRRLIELGADILSECNHRYSAVHLASKTGHTEAVQVRLEHGANVTKAYYFTGSPLTSAARNDHLEIVQLLRESGGRLNKQGGFSCFRKVHIF